MATNRWQSPYSLLPTPCLLLLASCFLLLTSCLSPTTRFPGTVRPTVKIGLVAPFEGRYRYVGYDVIYAVRLALREANAAGGVGGYSVELVAYDDRADPALAVEQARKLAADPAVVVAVGHFHEGTTAAVLSADAPSAYAPSAYASSAYAPSAYTEAGIPLVAPAVLGPLLLYEESRFSQVYRMGPDAEAVASALLHRLQRWGHRQVALVTEDGPLGAVLQRDAQQYRLRVWPLVSPENPDWLEEVRGSGVEVVFCDADPVTAGEVITALRQSGWEGVFLGGPELAASDFVAVAGQAAEGAVFVTPWPFPADVPGGADFVAAYRAASNGVPPGPLALPAYETAWVLLEALQRDIATHGTPSREGMAAALSATQRQGMLGSITFDVDRGWDAAPLYWYRVAAEGVPVRVP